MEASSKMAVLVQLLRLMEVGNRILVFSQFQLGGNRILVEGGRRRAWRSYAWTGPPRAG